MINCHICGENVTDLPLDKVVPIKKENETVYCCTKHAGTVELYNEQNEETEIKQAPQAPERG